MFCIPFYSANGLILLDLKVNDKPRVLLLDTGATVTLFGAPGLGEIRVAEHFVFAVQAHEIGRLGNIDDRKNLNLLGVSGLLGEDLLRYLKFRSDVLEAFRRRR